MRRDYWGAMAVRQFSLIRYTLLCDSLSPTFWYLPTFLPSRQTEGTYATHGLYGSPQGQCTCFSHHQVHTLRHTTCSWKLYTANGSRRAGTSHSKLVPGISDLDLATTNWPINEVISHGWPPHGTNCSSTLLHHQVARASGAHGASPTLLPTVVVPL